MLLPMKSYTVTGVTRETILTEKKQDVGILI